MPDYEEIIAQNVIINEMSKAKYDTITPNPLELYLTPDTTDQDIADAISTHNTSNTAHADIRALIPTVNDATLTIQKNGTDVQTFTANASSNVTANITVPTDLGDLTNNAGFIKGITSSDVITALGYTPYNSTNPNGYITSSALSGYLTTSDIVSSVDSTSTNSKAVGAKLFYDTCGDIETALQTIRGV